MAVKCVAKDVDVFLHGAVHVQRCTAADLSIVHHVLPLLVLHSLVDIGCVGDVQVEVFRSTLRRVSLRVVGRVDWGYEDVLLDWSVLLLLLHLVEFAQVAAQVGLPNLVV